MSSDDAYAGLPGTADSDAPEQVPPGTARVESRLSGGAGGGYDREGFLDRGIDRARDLYDDVRSRTGEWGERAGHLGERASHVASRAGDQLNSALHRAEERLEEQSGVVSIVREHPLLATALAFGVGFLVAGDAGGGRGITGRAVGHLRKAVLAGVTTALMQELQELLDEHGGPGGLLAALTGSEEGDA